MVNARFTQKKIDAKTAPKKENVNTRYNRIKIDPKSPTNKENKLRNSQGALDLIKPVVTEEDSEEELINYIFLHSKLRPLEENDSKLFLDLNLFNEFSIKKTPKPGPTDPQPLLHPITEVKEIQPVQSSKPYEPPHLDNTQDVIISRDRIFDNNDPRMQNDVLKLLRLERREGKTFSLFATDEEEEQFLNSFEVDEGSDDGSIGSNDSAEAWKPPVKDESDEEFPLEDEELEELEEPDELSLEDEEEEPPVPSSEEVLEIPEEDEEKKVDEDNAPPSSHGDIIPFEEMPQKEPEGTGDTIKADDEQIFKSEEPKLDVPEEALKKLDEPAKEEIEVDAQDKSVEDQDKEITMKADEVPVDERREYKEPELVPPQEDNLSLEESKIETPKEDQQIKYIPPEELEEEALDVFDTTLEDQDEEITIKSHGVPMDESRYSEEPELVHHQEDTLSLEESKTETPEEGKQTENIPPEEILPTDEKLSDVLEETTLPPEELVDTFYDASETLNAEKENVIHKTYPKLPTPDAEEDQGDQEAERVLGEVSPVSVTTIEETVLPPLIFEKDLPTEVEVPIPLKDVDAKVDLTAQQGEDREHWQDLIVKDAKATTDLTKGSESEGEPQTGEEGDNLLSKDKGTLEEESSFFEQNQPLLILDEKDAKPLSKTKEAGLQKLEDLVPKSIDHTEVEVKKEQTEEVVPEVSSIDLKGAKATVNLAKLVVALKRSSSNKKSKEKKKIPLKGAAAKLNLILGDDDLSYNEYEAVIVTHEPGEEIPKPKRLVSFSNIATHISDEDGSGKKTVIYVDIKTSSTELIDRLRHSGKFYIIHEVDEATSTKSIVFFDIATAAPLEELDELHEREEKIIDALEKEMGEGEEYKKPKAEVKDRGEEKIIDYPKIRVRKDLKMPKAEVFESFSESIASMEDEDQPMEREEKTIEIRIVKGEEFKMHKPEMGALVEPQESLEKSEIRNLEKYDEDKSEGSSISEDELFRIFQIPIFCKCGCDRMYPYGEWLFLKQHRLNQVGHSTMKNFDSIKFVRCRKKSFLNYCDIK